MDLFHLFGLSQWPSFLAGCETWMAAVAALAWVALLFAAAIQASEPCNWNLDGSPGHRLGDRLFERSEIKTPSGHCLRLSAGSRSLQPSRLRRLVRSDGERQICRLANLSEELLATTGTVNPVGSSQSDVGACIRSMQIASTIRSWSPVPREISALISPKLRY